MKTRKEHREEVSLRVFEFSSLRPVNFLLEALCFLSAGLRGSLPFGDLD
jgi:hypothetical protein